VRAVIDAVGRVDSLLVVGGRSEIGLAAARRLVAAGTRRVVLAVREPERSEADADELRRLGAQRVDVIHFDAGDGPPGWDRFIDETFSLGFDIDLALIAFGVLGRDDDGDNAGDLASAARTLETNFVAAAAVTLGLAMRMRTQGHGVLVALSSVAGERVRRANFVYGASKAGLDGFAQGLGDLLEGSGVRVIVVRPGFVHTKMTEGLPPAPLSVGADDVAAVIQRSVRERKEVVWVPGTLRWVMLALRVLPRPLFRRVTRSG
jgi:decaprenylphospho-beta-D-erythro-pentofuranosid-2-ulose 2-reductase